MAGKVRVDAIHPPLANRIDLIARTCPVTTHYGERCLVYDMHSGAIGVCPFLYGLAVSSGRHHLGEARSMDELGGWMSCDEAAVVRSYTVLCTEASRAQTEQGAYI